MKPADRIESQLIRTKLAERIAEIGQYAAVGYAQRVVGRKETGSFTFEDVEQVNAGDAEHFLMCYQHLCQAHLARLGKVKPVDIANVTDTGTEVDDAIPVESKVKG